MKMLHSFDEWLAESEKIMESQSELSVEKGKVAGSGESYWLVNNDYEDLAGNVSYTMTAKEIGVFAVEGDPKNAKSWLEKQMLSTFNADSEKELDFKLADSYHQLDPVAVGNGSKKFLVLTYSDDDRDLDDVESAIVSADSKEEASKLAKKALKADPKDIFAI